MALPCLSGSGRRPGSRTGTAAPRAQAGGAGADDQDITLHVHLSRANAGTRPDDHAEAQVWRRRVSPVLTAVNFAADAATPTCIRAFGLISINTQILRIPISGIGSPH
jgi:hypothetical protein